MPDPSPIALPPKRVRAAVAIAVLAAILAEALLLYTLHRGVGLENDAIDYVSTARSLLAGRGFKTLGAQGDWVPLKVFPPGYPLVLAAGGWFSGDPVTAAPYVQALIYALTAFTIVMAAFAVTRSLLAAALAGALAASALMSAETMALSEGTFICIAIASLWALAAYLREGKRGWLIATAAGFAAAIMVRYAGVSLVVAGVIALAWLGRRSQRTRGRGWRGTLTDVIVLCVIAATPMVAWAARGASDSGGAGVGRKAGFHPAELKAYHSVLNVAAGMIAPIGKKHAGPMTNSTRLNKGEWLAAAELLLAAVLIAAYFANRQRRRRLIEDVSHWPAAELILVMLIYAAIYLPFLFVSISFIDHATAPNYRILSPMIVPLILAIVGIAALKFASGRRPIARGMAVALLACVVAVHGYRTLRSARDTHRAGLGYQRDEWQYSQTMRQASALPPGALIYTNASDAIYFLTGRLSCTLPRTAERKNAQINDTHQVQVSLHSMAKDLTARDGVIVYFDNMKREDFLASKRQLQENLSLEAYTPEGFMGEPNDGGLWKLKAAAARR